MDFRKDWQLVLKHLPANYEALAHEYKLLETQYGNAKVTTAEQLFRVFFVHVGAELPLRDTAERPSRTFASAMECLRIDCFKH